MRLRAAKVLRDSQQGAQGLLARFDAGAVRRTGFLCRCGCYAHLARAGPFPVQDVLRQRSTQTQTFLQRLPYTR